MTQSFSSEKRKASRKIAAERQGVKRFENAWCQRGHSVHQEPMRRPDKFNHDRTKSGMRFDYVDR